MGFAQQVLGARATASGYDARKRQVLIEGEAARNAAYAQATASEQVSKKHLRQVGEDMARVAGNKRRAEGAARAAAAGGGWVQGVGAGDAAEGLVGRGFEQRLADMARSGSVESMNALNDQVGLRRQGDGELRRAQSAAEQFRAMAKLTRTGAWLGALGGVVGSAVGAVRGVGAAEGYNARNAADIASGAKEAASLWDAGVGGALRGGNGGAGFLMAGNPFTVGAAGDGWQKDLLGLLVKSKG